jgi:uncharacterized protein (TIGR00251 family)
MGRNGFVKIQVKVAPSSRTEAVIKDGERYLVKVKEPPKEGKANGAIIKLLAEYFKVPKASLRVVSGLSSKNKIVEIPG